MVSRFLVGGFGGYMGKVSCENACDVYFVWGILGDV